MSYHHMLFLIGNKACAWTGAIAQNVWPQAPCNAEEAWSMGAIVVGFFALLALAAVVRRIDAWHNYHRR